MDKKTRKKILDLARQYPNKESAILPALDIVQCENNNYLSTEGMKDTAELLNTSDSRVFSVATFYTMFNKKPVGKFYLQIDTNIPGILAGADKILEHIKEVLNIKEGQTTKDGIFTLSTVEDLGSCGTCPVIQVNDTYYESMTIEKTDELIDSLRAGIMPAPDIGSCYGTDCNILLKNRGNSKSVKIEEYKKTGGYRALEKAYLMEPEEIISQVKESMLRGRGGAGFPTGLKWSFLPENDPRPVYLICNADEGEPGTFKDRQIMQYDPHLLIEGIAISAFAIGAKTAFIYIRGEFRWISYILQDAVSQAEADGLLENVQIIVHRGAGSYVCGDETALIESLEGKRGYPRQKPPFPAQTGLYGCPTVINNVETLASIPFIVEQGAKAFRKIGTIGNSGPKLYGVSGHVNKPGVYEYPLGEYLTTILRAAGGIKGTLKAVIVGGLSVPILKANEIKNLKMDYDDCLKAGTMLGSGGIIVLNDTVSIPKIALRTIDFYVHESCGQCTPCRDGATAIQSLLKKILKGMGKTADIDLILYLCNNIEGLTLCPTGDSISMSIRAMLTKFREEFEELIKEPVKRKK